MGNKIITLGNIEVQRNKFHQQKKTILIYDVNIDRIVVSNKVPFGKKGLKYFIDYDDDHEEIMFLRIMLPKMDDNRRDFNETKRMYFLIINNKVLEKYNEI